MADDQKSTEDMAVLLHDLGNRMERLKQLYEQYFMGIERIEPLVARKEVTRTMMTLQQGYIRNTAIRFKFNTMLQKWSSYTTYWNRSLREIENGTYVRHIQKAQRKAEKEGTALPSEMRIRALASSVHEEPKPAKVEQGVAKPAAPPAAPRSGGPPPIPAGAKPPPIPVGARTPPAGTPSTATPPGGTTFTVTPATGVPRATTPATGVSRPPGATGTIPGMSETELRALHKKYVDARQAVGDIAPVRYETLVASLAKQVPKVLGQPGVRGVKFDVAVQGGKAILKAIPTK